MLNWSRCTSYDALDDLPERIWAGFPDVAGRRVFLKPNLVSPPTVWDAASCTDVRVTALVVRRALDAGAALVRIGECGFKDQWESTMALSGYPALRDMDPRVEIVPLQDGPNFHKFTLLRHENYMSLYGAKISDYLLDCDVVISLPKLKVHSMAYVTGAIKNMMGCMGQKGSMHPGACHKILHKRLHDLYFLLRSRIQWCMMDGIIGAEYWEQYGLPRRANVILSSDDPWAMDCAAAQVMGVPAGDVHYLRYIRESRAEDFPRIPASLVTPFERPLAWRS